jgi:uncharacterized protein (TIGR02118 family)
MIKLIVAVKRHPDMSPEAFHAYWRESHSAKVKSIAASERYVRRYEQCHTLPEEYAGGEPAYDGTAELWFDSVADKEAFFSDPDYLAIVQPDEFHFADMEQTRFFMTEVEGVI